jgi:hypothetical protein
MLPWERIAAIVGAIGVGAFFLASGFQTPGTNWADQMCGFQLCIRPEWISVGVAAFVTAYFIWKPPGT